MPASTPPASVPAIDRTAKLFIGGRQARPDSGYSFPVYGADGQAAGEAGLGNRKDIRNAVEAAHKAAGWATTPAHTRAQVVYYIAENLAARAAEFAARLDALTKAGSAAAVREVDLSIERLYTWAAWADKHDGRVHATPFRNVTLAMNEAVGVIGVVCPEAPPLLGFVSAFAPAVALGNTVVVVPSEPHALVATDFYQVLETSDVPPGVVNIVTGPRDELAAVLAAHDDVDGVWYWGSQPGSAEVERLAAGNMKRTWVSYGRPRDWHDRVHGAGDEFRTRATEVKNVWIPYGE